MFAECRTLAELNQKRKDAIRRGELPTKVNSAYNQARARLMNIQSTSATIPSYPVTKKSTPVYTPFPIVGLDGKPNQILLVEGGLLL